MTRERARKQAIRRRMVQTGEKYTRARRALLAGASGDERPFWEAEPFWEDERRQFERLAARHGEAVGRAGIFAQLRLFQLKCLMAFITPGFTHTRGFPESDAAAIAASGTLVAAGFGPQIERNRQIVERVLALIEAGALGAAPRRREQPARRRARTADEQELRASPWPDRERSTELEHECERVPPDRALQRPEENWFRAHRRGIGDSVLVGLIDAWIDDLERNYAQLVEAIPPDWREHGELEFDALIDGPDGEDGLSTTDATGGLPSPARVRVDEPIRGEIAGRELVATSMLPVAGRLASQLDGIEAFPHERWRIRGHRLSDGTIMPCLGSYRVARAETP